MAKISSMLGIGKLLVRTLYACIVSSIRYWLNLRRSMW